MNSFFGLNKNTMFNMANNVFEKDHNITIEGNESIKDVYLQDMKDTAENNDYEDISDINKRTLI